MILVGLLVSCAGQAQINNYKLLSDEMSEAYVPGSAWYWDPNKSGMGLNVTIQKSKHGSSGYFMFAAFYAHNEDGSQVWYTVQSEYLPNEDVNAWREDRNVFGTPWGGNDAWMGEVNADLYLATNGMPLGQAHKPNDIQVYKPVRMVWRNPNDVDIYIDGDTSPTLSFVRQNMHGDIRLGDADYLTDNYFKMIGLQHGFERNGTDVNVKHITSSVTFNKFDPLNYFENNNSANEFKEFTEYSSSKFYYISHAPVGHLDGVYNKNGQGGDDVFRSLEGFPRSSKWVVLTYNTSDKTIDGYYVWANNGDPSKGLLPYMANYKFKGYLPGEDQGRISLYPAKCVSCGSTTGDDGSFIKGLTRRSAWHLFKMPDDAGLSLGQLPDVYEPGFNITHED